MKASVVMFACAGLFAIGVFSNSWRVSTQSDYGEARVGLRSVIYCVQGDCGTTADEMPRSGDVTMGLGLVAMVACFICAIAIRTQREAHGALVVTIVAALCLLSAITFLFTIPFDVRHDTSIGYAALCYLVASMTACATGFVAHLSRVAARREAQPA